MRSPLRRPITDSPGDGWYGGAVNTVRWLVCSRTSRAVISFVVLAIGRLWSARCWNNTAPVLASITIAALALRCGGAPAAAALPHNSSAATDSAPARLAAIPAGRKLTGAVLSSDR